MLEKEQFMRRRTVVLGALVIVALLAGSGCQGSRTAEKLGVVKAPIVNGQTESGWPGVGALVIDMGGWGVSQFCTGTLIHREWVLTAAHCVTPTAEAPEIVAENVQFFIGNNVDQATTGNLYQADAFYPHPSYDDRMMTNDIGLVHLAEPVSSGTLYPINTTSFTSAFLGDDIFYVGFGASDGSSSTGNGIKRSTTIQLSDYESTYYITEYNGSNVCFGDSGGPGFMQIDGVWKVAGIVSGGTSDNCIGGYDYSTRVDAFVSWINGHVGGTTTSCLEMPSLCSCTEACQPDGTCDNTACPTTTDADCEAVYDCIVGCDQADSDCQQACYDSGTAEAQGAYEALVGCLNDNCSNATTNEAFQECAYASCETEIDGCFGGGGTTPTGSGTCEEAYGCLVDCDQSDSTCQSGCYGAASSTGQAQLGAMLQCFEDECSGATTNEEFAACAYDLCASEVAACFPVADCDLRGGECPAGEGCYPAGDGQTDCYATDGVRVGAACDETVTDRLVCVDGALCIGESGAATCLAYCLASSDCGDGEACDMPVYEDLAGVGVCVPAGTCTDADGDGACAGGDCDDTNRAVYPGATEICDNGIDDDCDSQRDEGCGTQPTEDAGGGSGGGTDVVAPGADVATPAADAGVKPGADVAGGSPDQGGVSIDDPDGDLLDLGTGGSGCTASPLGAAAGPSTLFLALALLGVLLRRRA